MSRPPRTAARSKAGQSLGGAERSEGESTFHMP